jgi:hypothetical protein
MQARTIVLIGNLLLIVSSCLSVFLYVRIRAAVNQRLGSADQFAVIGLQNPSRGTLLERHREFFPASPARRFYIASSVITIAALIASLWEVFK